MSGAASLPHMTKHSNERQSDTNPRQHLARKITDVTGSPEAKWPVIPPVIYSEEGGNKFPKEMSGENTGF